MPVFRLDPVAEGRDDPSWEASTFQETCWVTARDELNARLQLEGVSLKMVDIKPGRTKLYSPWQNDALTSCTEDVAPVGMKDGIVWPLSGKTHPRPKLG